MNLLADHCVYGQTVRLLREAGHLVVWLKEIGKQEAEDEEILLVARSRDMVLVTCDLDFGDILRYPPATHEGIIVLRINPPESLVAVHAVLLDLLKRVGRETLRAGLTVINSAGYRIRR